MRILLTGRHGQVGSALLPLLAPLGEVLATDRAALDLADLDAVRRAVRDARPDVVVNAAAHTAVDRAESEADLAQRINGDAPGAMAEETKRAGALLVHFSTDYVFDGSKAGAYVEDDATAPQSAYGRSKLAGERAVLGSGARCVVLRASWVYAPAGRNFYLTIAAKLRRGEALRVVDDQVGVPTTAAFLARATVEAIRRAAKGTLPHALYHLAPTGEVSWCGFARAIAARVAPGASVAAIASADYPQAAKRPARSVLDASRARAELGLPATPWEALLDECVAAGRA